MENASKALIMSAGILIGILILSLGVHLYNTLGEYLEKTEVEIAQTQLQQFNNQFLKYANTKELTIQDVITAKNRALENNYKYSEYNGESAEENNKFIDVFLDNHLILFKSSEELLKSSQHQKYKCTVKISSETQRVYKLNFETLD